MEEELSFPIDPLDPAYNAAIERAQLARERADQIAARLTTLEERVAALRRQVSVADARGTGCHGRDDGSAAES